MWIVGRPQPLSEGSEVPACPFDRTLGALADAFSVWKMSKAEIMVELRGGYFPKLGRSCRRSGRRLWCHRSRYVGR